MRGRDVLKDIAFHSAVSSFHSCQAVHLDVYQAKASAKPQLIPYIFEAESVKSDNK